MYTSYIKIIFCWAMMLIFSMMSYSFAQTGTTDTGSQTITSLSGSSISLTNFSKSRHDSILQKIADLHSVLYSGAGTGVYYRDMVSVLQCLQIPFADSDKISLGIIDQLSGDIQNDRQAIDHDILALLSLPASDVRVSLMKQRIESTKEKYMNMIDALTLSINANRAISLQSLDLIIGKNKLLLNQLLADKRIVDTMISTSADRQNAMGMRKTTLGFTQAQMESIIANYRQSMSSAIASGLDAREVFLLRKYKDIIPFAPYVQQEKLNFLTAYQDQINDWFAQRLGDVTTGSSYIQRLQETVSLMKEQFYQSGSLQCGLLTTMTDLQRSNYKNIITELKQSMTILPSSTTVSTSSTSGSIISSIALSSGFVTALNEWYGSSYRQLIKTFTASVDEKAILRKRAIRAEKIQLNAIKVELVRYRQMSSLQTSSLDEKKALKQSILTSVAQMQKQGVLSYNTQKSLDGIIKELNIKK